MILIAIEHTEHTFILDAADTYLGCFTKLSGATIEDVISRAEPTLRAWSELGATVRLRKASTRPIAHP